MTKHHNEIMYLLENIKELNGPNIYERIDSYEGKDELFMLVSNLRAHSQSHEKNLKLVLVFTWDKVLFVESAKSSLKIFISRIKNNTLCLFRHQMLRSLHVELWFF